MDKQISDLGFLFFWCYLERDLQHVLCWLQGWSRGTIMG